jgi:hypothetical protein
MAATPECLELPRPVQLVRTTGWNLSESFGLPLASYALASWLWGVTAGVLAMLAAIWITAGIRKLVTGSIPSLLMIALIVLTVQAVVAAATGNLWIFLVHFPLANLGLCILFGLSARGHSPLAERLAGEVIGLRCPECYQSSLHPFFRHITWLWAGIFLLLALTLGALLATVPLKTYVLVWAVTTIVLIVAGVGISVLWLRSVLRRLGIGFRFEPAPAA